MMPFGSQPIDSVFGEPFTPPHIANPTAEQVHEQHQVC